MKRITLLLVFSASLVLPHAYASPPPLAGPASGFATTTSKSNRILARAYRIGRSEFHIRCVGRVTRLLSDDTEGIRHQRFLLRLSTGQTLLIAHNIDLAPRIDTIQVGDRVVVQGEYIWNDLGGLIHYTHRDPDGEGFHGYIRHKKILYR